VGTCVCDLEEAVAPSPSGRRVMGDLPWIHRAVGDLLHCHEEEEGAQESNHCRGRVSAGAARRLEGVTSV
jgi:hypothetical protein